MLKIGLPVIKYQIFCCLYYPVILSGHILNAFALVNRVIGWSPWLLEIWDADVVCVWWVLKLWKSLFLHEHLSDQPPPSSPSTSFIVRDSFTLYIYSERQTGSSSKWRKLKICVSLMVSEIQGESLQSISQCQRKALQVVIHARAQQKGQVGLVVQICTCAGIATF